MPKKRGPLVSEVHSYDRFTRGDAEQQLLSLRGEGPQPLSVKSSAAMQARRLLPASKDSSSKTASQPSHLSSGRRDTRDARLGAADSLSAPKNARQHRTLQRRKHQPLLRSRHRHDKSSSSSLQSPKSHPEKIMRTLQSKLAEVRPRQSTVIPKIKDLASSDSTRGCNGKVRRTDDHIQVERCETNADLERSPYISDCVNKFAGSAEASTEERALVEEGPRHAGVRSSGDGSITTHGSIVHRIPVRASTLSLTDANYQRRQHCSSLIGSEVGDTVSFSSQHNRSRVSSSSSSSNLFSFRDVKQQCFDTLGSEATASMSDEDRFEETVAKMNKAVEERERRLEREWITRLETRENQLLSRAREEAELSLRQHALQIDTLKARYRREAEDVSRAHTKEIERLERRYSSATRERRAAEIEADSLRDQLASSRVKFKRKVDSLVAQATDNSVSLWDSEGGYDDVPAATHSASNREFDRFGLVEYAAEGGWGGVDRRDVNDDSDQRRDDKCVGPRRQKKSHQRNRPQHRRRRGNDELSNEDEEGCAGDDEHSDPLQVCFDWLD